MKSTRPILAFIFAPVLILQVLFLAGCPATTGTGPRVTLEPGGVYTDPVVADADRTILAATDTLNAFAAWAVSTPWSEVVSLGTQVRDHKSEWIRKAYEARDAYYVAARAWKQGAAASPDPEHATLTAALALLTEITNQINAARAAHPQ